MLLRACFVALFLARASFGANVLVLQGDMSDFGRKFFSGFSSATTESLKAFQYDASRDKAILDHIKTMRPDLILTIGKAPIEAMVSLLPSTPFVVADYFNPALGKKPNVVLMEQIPPTDAAVDLMLRFKPTVKNLGTIYNPQYSQDVFNLLVKSATKRGVRVASIKASNPADVAAYVSAFQGKIDAYFAIRDLSTSGAQAADAIFDFADKNQVPVVSLDPLHQNRPALVTLALDPIQLGVQAWEMAKVILREKKIPQVSGAVDPSELSLTVSMRAISFLPTGLATLPKFLQEATDQRFAVRVIQ